MYLLRIYSSWEEVFWIQNISFTATSEYLQKNSPVVTAEKGGYGINSRGDRRWYSGVYLVESRTNKDYLDGCS